MFDKRLNSKLPPLTDHHRSGQYVFDQENCDQELRTTNPTKSLSFQHISFSHRDNIPDAFRLFIVLGFLLPASVPSGFPVNQTITGIYNTS
jgi:hypothetical protein